MTEDKHDPKPKDGRFDMYHFVSRVDVWLFVLFILTVLGLVLRFVFAGTPPV